jgi:hypothetical protein
MTSTAIRPYVWYMANQPARRARRVFEGSERALRTVISYRTSSPPLTSGSLTSFVSRHALEGINHAQTQEDLNDLLLADSSVLILQTSSSKDTALSKSIGEQAKGKITFGWVDSPKLHVSQKSSPSLLCYRNGEDYTYTIPLHATEPDRALVGDDVRNRENVRLFLEHCAAPRVYEFSRRRMNKLYAVSTTSPRSSTG